jgi:anthranilate synthase component 1
MITPTYEEFESLCTRGNLIPVYREHLADVETPVSVAARFARDTRLFLLESVEGGMRWGRYSFIGLQPHTLFTVENGQAMVEDANGERTVLSSADHGVTALRAIMAQTAPVLLPELPRFIGGAVGFMNYETVREFERLPEPKQAPSGPTACFMLTDTMIVFDNVRHTMKIVAGARPDRFASTKAAYQDAVRRIAAIEERLQAPVDLRPRLTGAAPALSSNVTPEQFREMVRRARELIFEGDIIQVVLSQRFSGELPADPITLYRALRLINPSPYTFYLKVGEHLLVGSSPEVMVRLTGDRAELRPIAGTRPRGATEQEDRALADELLADEKERAEHLMLVDLGRNDLGRVAAPASVQVKDFMTIERYSHVMHIVSTVQATLAAGLDAFDLIRATFPAGTLSGAPKIRAMQIIHELESQPRGAYGGAVGYIGYDGNMDLAITIRTLEIDGHRVAVQAGAGIVYDSDPDKEYQETCQKARGMVRALELAAAGLSL